MSIDYVRKYVHYILIKVKNVCYGFTVSFSLLSFILTCPDMFYKYCILPLLPSLVKTFPHVGTSFPLCHGSDAS